ncbi:hypothetical protein ACFWCB_25400 [Streptomyces sp. NPDC060048]
MPPLESRLTWAAIILAVRAAADGLDGLTNWESIALTTAPARGALPVS